MQTPTDKKAEPLPIIVELIDTTQSANKRLDTVVCRLRTVRERLFGSEPEPDGPVVGTPVKSGSISVLRTEIEAFHTRLLEAEHLLSQIERFV